MHTDIELIAGRLRFRSRVPCKTMADWDRGPIPKKAGLLDDQRTLIREAAPGKGVLGLGRVVFAQLHSCWKSRIVAMLCRHA